MAHRKAQKDVRNKLFSLQYKNLFDSIWNYNRNKLALSR